MTKNPKSAPASLIPDPGPAQETGLAMVSDLDELEQAEEAILEARLAGEESVAAYLYVILPDEQNRLPKAVVGPTADFVVQLVRRINQASRGRVKLKLLPEPPVVTDFTVPDDRGRQVPFVRVIVGAIDEVSGEVTYGIKETKRAGKDPTSVAHTRAIRRALELHPSYDRRRVGRFIREKLRELGYDPEKFVVQAGAGGGEWGKFFAMARAQGVDPKQLRAAVREKTGKGLSEATTAAEVDQAAQAAHQALQSPAAKAEDGGSGATLTSDAGNGAGDASAPASPPIPYPGVDDATAITHLRASCTDYVKNMGVEPAAADRLWKTIKPAGDPHELKVQRLRYLRFFRVLYGLSIGEQERKAIKDALETYPDPPAAVAAGAAGA